MYVTPPAPPAPLIMSWVRARVGVSIRVRVRVKVRVRMPPIQCFIH